MSTTEPGGGVFVALLRGVNVGRNRRVRMADLRDALAADGFGRVRTLLNSGNVVVDAPGQGPDEVGRRVHDAVLACSGHDVAVVVRTAGQLAEVVARTPLPDPPDGSRYFVAFLGDEAAEVDLPEVGDGSTEQWWRRGGELYVWCPDGLAESTLMTASPGRGAPPVTVRNWNTVTRLARLSAS